MPSTNTSTPRAPTIFESPLCLAAGMLTGALVAVLLMRLARRVYPFAALYPPSESPETQTSALPVSTPLPVLGPTGLMGKDSEKAPL